MRTVLFFEVWSYLKYWRKYDDLRPPQNPQKGGVVALAIDNLGSVARG